MPNKAPEEPKPLSFATPNPWSALPREVHVGTGHGKKEGATTESPVDGQDQPKIYTIRDHTLEVLMHPDVLELHAVRVVHTPHGAERQLHLKVRVRCGREEKVVDVLVDTGAQVSLVRRGLFKEEILQPSRRPVRLKVANGEIMGGGTHEATISMEFWEHERFTPLRAHQDFKGMVYEADKKAYFAAHPEKKPKEQRISDWKAKGGDGGKGQGKGQGKGGGGGYGGGPGQDPRVRSIEEVAEDMLRTLEELKAQQRGGQSPGGSQPEGAAGSQV